MINNNQIYKARNFRGEGNVNGSTWIKKTSFPEIQGQEFQAFKNILVVRSPFDVVRDNFAKKIAETKTYITMNFINTNEQLLSTYITQEIEKIQAFYEFWMESPLTTYILKFEDLIFDPENCLISLFQFLFEFQSLKGTKIENKILGFLKYNKNYTAMLEAFINSYEPAINFLTPLQKNIVIKYMKEYIWKFGYFNEENFEKLKSKNSYSEQELSLLLEEPGDKTSDSKKYYKENNVLTIKFLLDNAAKQKKYNVKTSIVINSKK